MQVQCQGNIYFHEGFAKRKGANINERVIIISLVGLAAVFLLIQLIPYGHKHSSPPIVQEQLPFKLPLICQFS